MFTSFFSPSATALSTPALPERNPRGLVKVQLWIQGVWVGPGD